MGESYPAHVKKAKSPSLSDLKQKTVLSIRNAAQLIDRTESGLRHFLERYEVPESVLCRVDSRIMVKNPEFFEWYKSSKVKPKKGRD